jgi:hypothetical protein
MESEMSYKSKFKEALIKLKEDGLEDPTKYFDLDERSFRRYKAGHRPIPMTLALAMAVLLNYDIDPARLRKLALGIMESENG